MGIKGKIIKLRLSSLSEVNKVANSLRASAQFQDEEPKKTVATIQGWKQAIQDASSFSHSTSFNPLAGLGRSHINDNGGNIKSEVNAFVGSEDEQTIKDAGGEQHGFELSDLNRRNINNNETKKKNNNNIHDEFSKEITSEYVNDESKRVSQIDEVAEQQEVEQNVQIPRSLHLFLVAFGVQLYVPPMSENIQHNSSNSVDGVEDENNAVFIGPSPPLASISNSEGRWKKVTTSILAYLNWTFYMFFIRTVLFLAIATALCDNVCVHVCCHLLSFAVTPHTLIILYRT